MNEQNQEFAARIGWDWADRGHRLCLRVLADGRTEHFDVPHKVHDLKAWLSELGRRFDGRKIAVAIEQRRGAVIYLLLQFDFIVVYPINTSAISNYRKALRSSGAKDDPSDAELLLNFLQGHSERLRALKPDDDLTIQLKALVEYRRKSVNEITSLVQQLKAALKLYYPQALEWLPKMKRAIACDFLMNWPSPQTVRRATPKKLREFFQKHNFRGQNLIERIASIKSVDPMTTNQAVVSSSIMIVRCLVEKIRTGNGCVTRLDKEIAALYYTHQDAKIYASLPGAGPALEPRLAVALGIDRTRYESAVELQQFSGTAPVTVRSGQSKWVHWRWACPKFMRQTFVEFAACSLPRCAWAKECYNKARARGMGHHAALRIVAFKWQRIIFRCWQDRLQYDERKYTRRLKQNRSPQRIIATNSGMTPAGQIIRRLKNHLDPRCGKNVQ